MDARFSQYRSAAACRRVFESYDAILARWPVPYESRYVETSFGRTHLLVAGRPPSPPLVLIHGGGGNAAMSWLPNVAGLSEHFRVFALDTIGDAGKSDGTRLPYESGDHARWIAEVCDGLDIPVVNIAGVSLGGWMAFRFGLAFPKKAQRVALLAPASLQEMNRWFMIRGLATVAFPNRWLLRKLVQTTRSPRAPKVPEWLFDHLAICWKSTRFNAYRIPVITDAEIRALEPPTLLLLGRDEVIYDVEEAASRVRSVASGIEIKLIADAGHAINGDRAQAVNEALTTFLKPEVAANGPYPAS